MAVFKVEGGHRLRGEITPQGAKNEALQILCATVLTREKVTVHNIPRILDVMQLIELLRRIGVEVEQLSETSYSFRAADINLDYFKTEDYCRRASSLRGSVMLLGPMLARFGVGYMPKPGGDKIGRRRLDTHFIGFQKLGATLDFDTRPQEQQEQIRREALEWAQDADAIFISHYHADHHGLLPDTHRDVAIYATAGTAAMMHVTEVIHGRGDAAYLRHISVLFKDADDRKFEPVIVGDICITPYTVDHAAYDACAFLIEAEGRRILYSGDIRRHGVKGFLYHNLPRKVDCLLLEGTNLATEKACMSEAEICERFKEQFRTDADKLHYVWCSGQNIDRIVQIYKAALVCSRKLIVDTYVAYVLEAVHRFKPSIPSPLSPFEGHDVFRYFCQHAQLKRFEKAGDPEIVQRLKALPTVDTTDIGHNPGKYVWLIRPSMLPYMQKYSHRPSVVVTSIWEGYEKDESEPSGAFAISQ